MSDAVKLTSQLLMKHEAGIVDPEYQNFPSGANAPRSTAVTVAVLDPGPVVDMEMIAVK